MLTQKNLSTLIGFKEKQFRYIQGQYQECVVEANPSYYLIGRVAAIGINTPGGKDCFSYQSGFTGTPNLVGNPVSVIIVLVIIRASYFFHQ